MTQHSRKPERPDPGGCVRRGAAATGIAELSKFGNAPRCRAGAGGRGLHAPRCNREAVMEVYGIEMCEAHGEEAAVGALEEIHEDLDGELRTLTNRGGRRTSPHLSAALERGYGAVEAYDDLATDPALLAAFPLRREEACVTVLAHAEDPDARMPAPYDNFRDDRLLLHRHMRLAFEEGADWLVEMLEQERVQVAAQAAYALALDPDLRPAERNG